MQKDDQPFTLSMQGMSNLFRDGGISTPESLAAFLRADQKPENTPLPEQPKSPAPSEQEG